MDREHHFKTEDAKNYGIECAIILYNIRFWLEKNKVNKKHIYEQNGTKYYWTYNSSRAFSEIFPYIPFSTISKRLRELESYGCIIVGTFNKKGYDKTKWYSTYEYSISTIEQSITTVEQSIATLEQPIPDNKTQIINTDIPMVSDVPSEKEFEALVKPNQEEFNPLVMLPLKFGKTSYLRLGKVYKDLWHVRYGTEYQISFGRFNKALKGLLELYSEVQVAALMYLFFHWEGGNGNDQRESIYLSGLGFPLEMLIKKTDIMIAYITNALDIDFNDPFLIKGYAARMLKNVLR